MCTETYAHLYTDVYTPVQLWAKPLTDGHPHVQLGRQPEIWPLPPSAHPQTGGKASTPSWVCRNSPALPAEVGREGEAAPMSCGACQMQTRLLLRLADGIFQPVIHFEHVGCELQRLQKKSSDFWLQPDGGEKKKNQPVQNSFLVWVCFDSFV